MTFFPNSHSLEFVKNVEHARSLGVQTIHLCPVVEADWNGWEERLEQAYQELADWFIAEMRDQRQPGLEVTWNFLRILHRIKTGGSQEAFKPCNIGSSLIGIRHTGEITPCHRHHDRKHWWGDVHQEALPEVRTSYLISEPRISSAAPTARVPSAAAAAGSWPWKLVKAFTATTLIIAS